MKRYLIFLGAAGILAFGYIWWAQTPKQQTEKSVSDNGLIQTTEISKECAGKAIPEFTEGPYYKANSPERQTIREADTPTIPLTLEGYVFDTDCKPIANAWIDFWQADGEGNYDNAGYELRGHQYTDANGRYRLLTVVPGQYPGRTEHIHFKIKASDTAREITSQLFLPNSESNEEDSIFDESLIINMKDAPDGYEKVATYNFVVSR